MSQNTKLHATFTRRNVLRGIGAAGALYFAGPMINRNAFQVFAASDTLYSKRAIDLVTQACAIDMLAPLTLNDAEWERWTHATAGMNAQEHARFADSGIKVLHHSIGFGGAGAFDEGLQYFGELNGFVSRYPDTFSRVLTVADIDALKTNGKTGLILGVQDSDHFRTPDDVKLFHGLGQRVSQLTYNAQNLIGCGSTEREDCGITDFGVAIIAKMNEVGMLVDVSHCGDKTTLEAFELSKKPIAITHSNCRALDKHPRLKTDEAIKKMGKSGGVIGISGVRMFVTAQEPTTIDNIIDHIDHAAKLAGVEHVGIGSDTDLIGYDAQPKEWLDKLKANYKKSYAFRDRIDIAGFDHPKKIFDLTEALIRRKRYSDADIVGILGGNFRRLFGQVWV